VSRKTGGHDQEKREKLAMQGEGGAGSISLNSKLQQLQSEDSEKSRSNEDYLEEDRGRGKLYVQT